MVAVFGASKSKLTPCRPVFHKLPDRCLLNRATYLGKHVVGIRPDEPDRAHDDYQNHSQHHCVFRNVLSTLIVPELL
jgi:hypothetical protein